MANTNRLIRYPGLKVLCKPWIKAPDPGKKLIGLEKMSVFV